MFINEVEVRTNPAGMVLFMSDWCRCDDFAAKGYFRAEPGGPATMGDTFFYLTDAGRRKSITNPLEGAIMVDRETLADGSNSIRLSRSIRVF